MPQKKIIYLDYQATTPVDTRVIQRMEPFFQMDYGNPSSTHIMGLRAKEAVELARNEIASFIGARTQEIFFTSGATESNNLALKGFAEKHRDQGNHIITVLTEHPAVLDTCKFLESRGFQVTYLPVTPSGLLNLEDFRKAIQPTTILASVMFVNNEIGVIQPIRQIGEICSDNKIAFHVDAAQAIGRIKINVDSLGIDMLSISGHKIYGPKGIGALFVRKRNNRIELEPQIHGGGHQEGIRSGTLPTHLIVGLAEAVNLFRIEGDQENRRIQELRDSLSEGLQTRIADIQVNGDFENRISGNLNLLIPGVDAQALMANLSHIAFSNGSACTSDALEPSHVLLAIGVPYEEAYNALRFSLGRFTTNEEIELVVRDLTRSVESLRSLHPA